jgi:hypothetical protein
LSRFPQTILPVSPADGRLDISATAARLVLDVRAFQVLAVQFLLDPPSTLGSTVVTPYASIDGVAGDTIHTEAITGDNATFAAHGDIVYIDRTLAPFPYLLLEVTTPHGTAGHFARFPATGYSPFTGH